MMMKDREKLNDIIDSCWKYFRSKYDYHVVVKPSVPIIWFGDLEAYKRSKLKIVTIGLNPSDNEFPNGEHAFQRFPEAEIIAAKNVLENKDKDILFNSLNSYFKTEPYSRWFDAYEIILKNLGTSFGGKFDPENEYNNRAVHIDLFTAIATSPTWGKLSKELKAYLSNIELCFELLEFLNPDIILISCNYPAFDLFKKHFEFKDDMLDYVYWKSNGDSVFTKSDDLSKVPRTKKKKHDSEYIYRIEKYQKDGKTLIWGPYRSKAFDYFSNIMKADIFSEIKKDISGE